MVRENLIGFPFGQYILGNALRGLSEDLVSRSKLGFTRNLLKCNSDFDCLLRKQQAFAAANYGIDFCYSHVGCGKRQQVIFITRRFMNMHDAITINTGVK